MHRKHHHPPTILRLGESRRMAIVEVAHLLEATAVAAGAAVEVKVEDHGQGPTRKMSPATKSKISITTMTPAQVGHPCLDLSPVGTEGKVLLRQCQRWLPKRIRFRVISLQVVARHRGIGGIPKPSMISSSKKKKRAALLGLRKRRGHPREERRVPVFEGR